MNKPLTVAVEQLKQDLINKINEASLHIALVKPVVDELKRLLDQEYERVYRQELVQYSKQEKEEVEQKTVPNEEAENE
jgi:Mg/Co/Ni transporter MgtE